MRNGKKKTQKKQIVTPLRWAPRDDTIIRKREMYPIVCEIYKDLLLLYATNRGLSLFKAYFQIYIPFKYWTSTVYTFKIGAHTIQASKERKLQKVTIERGGQKVGGKYILDANKIK